MTDIAIAKGCTIQKYPDLNYAKESDPVEWVLNSQQIYIFRGELGLAYSFVNVSATLIAPGFIIQLGSGAAPTEGGITLAYAGDHSNVVVGADGNAITSLFAGKAGAATIRLLKNSPANKMLNLLFAAQKAAPQSVGAQGILTITYSE